MAVSKVAFAAVGLACVTAAGAGGYFALRQNVPPDSSTAAVATLDTTAPEPASTPAASVQETEAVVAPVGKPDMETENV